MRDVLYYVKLEEEMLMWTTFHDATELMIVLLYEVECTFCLEYTLGLLSFDVSNL